MQTAPRDRGLFYCVRDVHCSGAQLPHLHGAGTIPQPLHPFASETNRIAPDHLANLRTVARDSSEQSVNLIISGDNDQVRCQSSFDQVEILGNRLPSLSGKAEMVYFVSKKSIPCNLWPEQFPSSSPHREHPTDQEDTPHLVRLGPHCERYGLPLSFNLRGKDGPVAYSEDLLKEFPTSEIGRAHV